MFEDQVDWCLRVQGKAHDSMDSSSRRDASGQDLYSNCEDNKGNAAAADAAPSSTNVGGDLERYSR